jgi:cysteine desulfurase/selenocysteine lyase
MNNLDLHFPFITRNLKINYLDSAATSQILDFVAEDLHYFNLDHRANAHRSGHSMGTWVDQQYHRSKEAIGRWLNIVNPHDCVVFNSGTTQGLDDAHRLIQQRYPRHHVYLGIDSHHSLYLPFSKSNHSIIDIDSAGRIDLVKLEVLLEEHNHRDLPVPVLALTAVSNVLGMVNDLEKIRSLAKKYRCVTVIDASQLVGKQPVDLSGFDFAVWSWHKIYGPMGLGCLAINESWLEELPVRPGGGSVTGVSLSEVNWQTTAGRFESGTQNLAAISALPRLVEWLEKNQQQIQEHDAMLAKHVHVRMPQEIVKPVTVSETGLVSLVPTVGTVEDYAMMLDAKNIMVRSGKLCAEPLVTKYSAGLIRISWAAYTSKKNIDQAFDEIISTHARLSKHVRRAV